MTGGSPFDMDDTDVAWCPGCGNFPLLASLKEALDELGKDPAEVVTVGGIGQGAKLPHYINTNIFVGLHGRALPPATAISASNPNLTVIAVGGDGDMYAEGGNHLVHTIRRNPDITNLVHNNMVYGLTRGQASPTSQKGFQTPVQTGGVTLGEFNPLAVAIALDASFVARAFVGDREGTRDIIKQAVTHRGYALVDILQPCVTFNHTNTYQYFRENTYRLGDDHDPTDRQAAFELASKQGKFGLGIYYLNKDRPTFNDGLEAYRTDPAPLFERTYDPVKISELIESKRSV